MTNKQFKKKLSRIKRRGERQKQLKELRDAYAKYMPEKKEKKVSNIVLIVTVIAISLYTIASFWLTHEVGVSIDSTLTTCFYTFWTSEVVLLAGIRVSKVVVKKPNYSDPTDTTECEYEEQ